MNKLIKRLWPIGVLLALAIGLYASGVLNYANFTTLKLHRDAVQLFVHTHPILAPLIYIGIYIASTALSLPIAIFLSISGGFLFPQPWCSIYTVIGATIGATIFFLAAKTLVGDSIKKRAGPLLKKVKKGFQKDAVSYMLFLRFVPIIPFWLTNAAPAFFGISLLPFVLTTFFGIIPGVVVFTQAGRGIDSILEQGDSFSVHTLFTKDIIFALAGLAILSLIPVVVRYVKGKKV